MGQAVTRVGDLDVTHCSTPARAVGSGNVFVNGIALSRQGDVNTVHLKPGDSSCVAHSAPISSGSTTVYINGKQCGRIGDPISGCTVVAQGSGNVFAGSGGAIVSISLGGSVLLNPATILQFELEEFSIAADDKEYPIAILTSRGISGTAQTIKESTVINKESTVINTVDHEEVLCGCEGIEITEDISKHFTLSQLSSNAVVSKYPLKEQHNLTIDELKCNLYNVAKLLDKIKDEYPTMFVTSGFRHGITSSKHEIGQAADFQIPNASKEDYYNAAVWIAENLEFDSLLLEFKNYGTKLPWIHISYNCESNRNIVQTYFNNRKHSDKLTLIK